MTEAGNRRFVAFAAVAAFGIMLEAVVTRAAPFHRSQVVSFAVLFDLTVVFPALFAVVVLRPTRRSLLDTVPVVAMGALVAAFLLAGRPGVAGPLRVAGAAAEVAALALLVRRVRAAARELRGTPSDDILIVLGTLSDPLSRLVGAELAVFYYAFVGPFVRPRLRAGEFRYTETSGLGGLLCGVALLLVMEGVGTHLLLHSWSARASWIHTALNAYALVWLAAMFQAARLRPVVVSDQRLLVRTSLLWTVDVPRAVIERVMDAEEASKTIGTLRAAVGAAPSLLIQLRSPVVARGPLGVSRTVTRIALHVDEPERLRAALA